LRVDSVGHLTHNRLGISSGDQIFRLQKKLHQGLECRFQVNILDFIRPQKEDAAQKTIILLLTTLPFQKQIAGKNNLSILIRISKPWKWNSEQSFNRNLVELKNTSMLQRIP